MNNRKCVKYKKPPLIEALCEFRFQKTGVFPNIILGRLYERLEKNFPTIKTYEDEGVQVATDGISPTDAVKEERTRFMSGDKTRFIQVGAGFLVVNQLEPYKDYASFREFVRDTVDTYYEIAEPKGLQSISLRYINRVELTDGQSLDEVFNIGFTVPQSFNCFPDMYFLRLEFDCHSGRDRLVVIFATAPELENSVKAAILDFDYALVNADIINGGLLEWMDEAHDEIEEAFYACLTESALASFEPEETLSA